MFIWELLAQRLRGAGWDVWHRRERSAEGPTFVVHIHRPGAAWKASGPTLTEAFAAAMRQARQQQGTAPSDSSHHLGSGLKAPRLRY